MADRRDQAVAHTLAVAGLAGVWIYQGVVPKLWKVDSSEVEYWRRMRFSERNARRAVRAAGVGEVALGVATVAFSGRRALFAGMLVAMPALVAATAVTDRSKLSREFNPVSLNWAVAALAGVALATADKPARR